MYCSGCGQALLNGATVCPACGRTVAGPVTPINTIPGFEWQLSNYAGKVKTLAIFWIVYAVYAVVVGFAGMTFMHLFFDSHSPWMQNNDLSNTPFAEEWFRILMNVVWVAVILRAILAIVAAWGLLTRSSWGRIVAIIAAFLSLVKIPFGTAMGIWTLVTLMGYRNSVLYEHLQNTEHPPAI